MVATVQTYDGLVASVISWANRNDADFATNVPLFISLTEQELSITLATLGNEEYLTGSFTANNGIIPKPAGWVDTVRFTYLDTLGNEIVLEKSNVSRLQVEYPSTLIASPILPRYYADYGYFYWMIGPTPTLALNFLVSCFVKQNPLSESNQTNWNTMFAYDLLFWGSMHKACVFINNTEWAAYYANLYQTGIQNYMSQDKGRLQDSTDKVEKE